jgi:hypothetical protein
MYILNYFKLCLFINLLVVPFELCSCPLDIQTPLKEVVRLVEYGCTTTSDSLKKSILLNKLCTQLLSTILS